MIDSSGHNNPWWYNKTKETSSLGIDHIYTYGIKYLKEVHARFHHQNHHKIDVYKSEYSPNPFRFQYDLCIYIWINYYHILKQEIKILRKDSLNDTADELQSTNVLYNISRADFFFAAAELRWPTTTLDDGSMHGLFIRDPWSERRINALSHETIKNVISFGGGGQGKTHVSLAFSLMIFDHYIFTQKGARCMISTVGEKKLRSAAWPYLCSLTSSTVENISLYAGKARIAGDYTLARPNNKDSGGVFQGLLIGDRMNDQVIVDKLTGSHGHPFISYIMDEMQSTPDPPITAAPNFTMHSKDYRIIGSGNYGLDEDTLGKNVKPDIGWDKVDEDSTQWISTMTNGSKAIVIYFNNNYSPAITKEGSIKYPHLPSLKILESRYSESVRNINNVSYRRFWIGFRLRENGSNNVIYDDLVKTNGADRPLILTKLFHTAFSFDSAQAEIDRNAMLIFEEGICSFTGERVFGPKRYEFIKKSTESTKYYKESAGNILKIAKQNKILSGNGIVDWTGRPAQAEILQENGFLVHKMVYNIAVPDGKKINPITKRVEREIRLNTNIEFTDIRPERVCAHNICENLISLGAWALRQYISCGRVRGINQELINDLTSERTLDVELYRRKFSYKNSTTHGQRFMLESKKEFKKMYGFSPDLLDTLFQAAYYMLVVRKLPLTSSVDDDKFANEAEQDIGEIYDDIYQHEILSL